MENKPNNHRGSGATTTTAAPTTTTTATAAATNAAAAVTEAAAPGPRRRGGGKRKANNNNSSSAASKRQSRGRTFTPLPHFNQNHSGPVTRARQSPAKAAAAAAAASAASSSYSPSSGFGAAAGVLDKPIEPLHQPTPPGSAIGEVTTASQQLINAEIDRIAPLEPAIDAEFEAIRSRDPNVHVVPTPAAWFSWTKIHPIEERALPSFFNGKLESRNSEIYMEIRNSIMKKFHKDPKTQIEIKDLAELTVGELDARQEVMEFLDYWGLINFHPFPEVGADTAESNNDDTAKIASLVNKLYRFEVPQSSSQERPKADLSTQVTPPRLFPESAIADEVRPEGPSVEYHCNSCSADCSRKRYHCQKQADFDLCSECYNNGKFDSGMSPADFILMEPAEVLGVSGGSWTDQETLLLLEALELFGENWSEIAEHVATKSKAQCILHFVQMPIEDTFLEGKDDFDASLQGNNVTGSTYDDSSTLKEFNEMVESKPAINTDLSALEESHEVKESNTTNNGSSSSNKSPETTESKSTAEDRPLSPKVEASDPIDAVEVTIPQEISANCAINALKEAFQVVGSGESISFADAGNPVMVLAAFLSGLVAPDIAAASARSSLKATPKETPGIQLASRHCFVLEDPAEDLNEPPASESAVVEMLDSVAKNDDGKAQKDKSQKEVHIKVQDKVTMEAQKEKDQKEEDFQVQKEEDFQVQKEVDRTNMQIENTVPKETVLLAPLPVEGKENCEKKEPIDVTTKEDVSPRSMNVPNDSALKEEDFQAQKGDCTNMEIEDTVPKETVLSVSLPVEKKENCEKEESIDMTMKEIVAPGSMNELNGSALRGQDQLSSNVGKEIVAANEPAEVTDKEDVVPSTMKESDDSALQGKGLPSTVNASGDIEIQLDVAPISVKESTVVAPPGEISQSPEVPKDVDMDSSSVPSKDKDPQETDAKDVDMDSSSVPSKYKDPPGEISQSPEVPKDVDMDSSSVPSKDKDPRETDAKDVDMDSSSVPSKDKDPQETDAKDVDMDSSSVPSKDKDPQETDAPNSAVDNGEISQSPEVPKDVDMDTGSVPSKDKDLRETVAPSLATDIGEISQAPQVPADVDMVSSSAPSKDTGSVPSKDKDLQETVAPSLATDIGEISQAPQVPADVDMVSSSAPSKDPQDTIAPSSVIDTGEIAGECGSKVVECKIEEPCNLSETKDDHGVEKVKRAALTALSAAAVKSKLLADQEEEQIRKLATFLIEKQLHKIETKLAFFADMESVIMRAKDQMDKSRQRLYQERGQIIAARLGMPASSSRAIPPSLASNRAAMSYANTAPKSVPNVNSLKAPVKTVTNTSAPSMPFSSVSNTGPGGSAHTSR